MPTHPLREDLRAWLTATYRQRGQTLERARAEADAARRATLEAEAATLEGICDTLEDCLYSYRDVKWLRIAVYQQMAQYQRHADRLERHSQEADDLQIARDNGYRAIVRQVLQEWAELLEGR